jgi:hypothetical protein
MMSAVGMLREPSWAALALAGVGWVLLAFVPGALLVAALDPWRSWVARAAVAPLVSVAVAFGVASWLQVLGVGWSPWQTVGVLGAVSVGSAAVLLRRDRPSARRAWLGDARRDAVVLGSSSVLASVVWLVGLVASGVGGSAVLPQADGLIHGQLATRMLLLGTVDPYRLNVTDLVEPAFRESYYPVAFHVLAATVAQASAVASSLLVAVTVVASVWGVLGTAALAREVAGRRVARRAAVASALLVPGVLFGNLWWGSFSTMLATAAVPGLLACLLALRSGRGRTVSALAVSGLLCAHATESLVVVGTCLVAFLLEPAARRRIGPSLTALAVAVAGALLLSLPTLRLLAAPGGAARPQEGSPSLEPVDALLHGLGVPLLAVVPAADLAGLVMVLAVVVVAVLAVTGAVRLRGTGAGRALVLVVVALLSLSVAAYAGPVGLAGSPWYGNAARIGTAAATYVPVLVGAGWLAADARAARADVVLGARVLAVSVACAMALQSVLAVGSGVAAGSVVTADDRAAFAWLADHVRPGERVLNEERDGSAWAYEATRGVVRPVFGAKPGEQFSGDPSFADRFHLQHHVADIATDARARRAAQEWDVRYVLVGAQTISDLPRIIDPDLLAAAPGVREVFRSGDAVVYELPSR